MLIVTVKTGGIISFFEGRKRDGDGDGEGGGEGPNGTLAW